MSELVLKVPKPKNMKEKGNRKQGVIGIYFPSMLSRRVTIPMKNVGEGVAIVIENIIKTKYEGKCIQEGFIKPGSSKILTYSSGELVADNVVFEVVFECLVCCPVEGMHISCVAKNITKAGIRAEVESGTESSPVIIFIARDHHYKNKNFSKIKEDDNIRIRVIGQRFELNDPNISILGELIDIETSSKRHKTEKVALRKVKSKKLKLKKPVDQDKVPEKKKKKVTMVVGEKKVIE